MLECFAFVRELDFLAVAVRLFAAVICGGAIGMEREYRRRPAGFRTHILICLGAAITTLTSQYLYVILKLYTDVARLGASVVAGIGFIGAGTIAVTNNKRVKGLTTAAGLWTSAIIGLVCGAGYLECAIFSTAMVLVAELLLIRIEYRYAKKIRDLNLYIEYKNAGCIEQIIRLTREKNVSMNGLEITRIPDVNDGHHFCAVLTLSVNRHHINDELLGSLNGIKDIIKLEEL